ncbi:hypothetical protein SKAU_G00412930 [Synaphobranchus kaupii]|uniref:Uncharacterized protein n=1 Tax=Synaphobranchus kaupii TaxID=118154 RepID=A0A9Q1IBW1_SYNKA|nr:hypothetical protein SKAU_G00412930 [Synaphobranchus kaupii]
MGMIWRMATPSAEDWQKKDGTPYKWLDYVHKVSSIILARHGDADRIICVNDPYDAAYSTKDNERDLRVQGKAHVPNTYMKLGDPFPSAREFKTLLCSISNKGRLQKLICSYLTDLTQNVDAEIVYSVGSHCTNLSTLQPMQNYSFDQSEADTILFSAYAVLRESGYSGPVIIDTADTDAYVAAAAISQQLPGGEEAQQKLLRCGDSLDPEEEVVEELFEFTRHVIYGDKKSITMAEARAAKWKRMKNKSFIRLPPDADSLRQHCLRANFLAYLVHHPSLKHHPSPLGHGWELVGGRCRPVRHTRPALPTHLPAPGPAEESEEDDENEEDEEEGDDDVQRRRGDSSESDDLESSEAECSDSD